jgi:hypothetical protein
MEGIPILTRFVLPGEGANTVGTSVAWVNGFLR